MRAATKERTHSERYRLSLLSHCLMFRVRNDIPLGWDDSFCGILILGSRKDRVIKETYLWGGLCRVKARRM